MADTAPSGSRGLAGSSPSRQSPRECRIAPAVGSTPALDHVDHDLASREECLGGGHVLAEDLRKSVAVIFVVHEALGGGIMASNRIDSVAKTMAQQLLAFPIPVSRVLAARLSNH
jgi:hypothetical protein